MALAALVGGCHTTNPLDENGAVPRRPIVGIEVRQDFDTPSTRKIDLLFVIDNAGSTIEEQSQLGRSFPLFFKALRTMRGGFPDIRIAVISSNMGAGRTDIGGNCYPLGERGRFQDGRRFGHC